MGTKRRPGKFDCYQAANPDEPMFVLLGRDRMAPDLVRRWADWREGMGEDPEVVREARDCADSMEGWLGLLGRAAQNPYSRLEEALSAWLDSQSVGRTSALRDAGLAFFGRDTYSLDEETTE